jgi:hypothetical protein
MISSIYAITTRGCELQRIKTLPRSLGSSPCFGSCIHLGRSGALLTRPNFTPSNLLLDLVNETSLTS